MGVGASAPPLLSSGRGPTLQPGTHLLLNLRRRSVRSSRIMSMLARETLSCNSKELYMKDAASQV